MKRISSFILALLMLVSVFPFSSFAANESGSPKHIPRVVSIVFDDSGSMYSGTDRWAYTSYAMQAFAAMMGSEDVLYVTYLNDHNKASGELKLSSGKQGVVDSLSKIAFGDGTPNKVQEGANHLINYYNNSKNKNEKYYLVVMADGELNLGEGKMSSTLETVNTSTATKLSGVDFETIYFSMKAGDQTKASGVDCRYVSDSEKIVSALKDVSANIMGRTVVENSVNGGKLSFKLTYPALSIAVLVQKENGSFSNVSIPITKDGSSASYKTDTYYIKCPTTIDRRVDYGSGKNEIIPKKPPAGFVSLITNGNNSISKGSYSLDLSAYGVSAKDVIVLVEPAVKIGCKYHLGETVTTDFNDIKDKLYKDSDLTVEFGLYEINSDGSLGDPVPESVLAPSYKIYIDDAEQKGVKDNKYTLKIEEKHSEKDLKIEAILKGYQPFVLRETFGKVNLTLSAPVPTDPNGKGGEVLTKPELENWKNGKGKIEFAFTEKVDKSVLPRYSIKIKGVDFIKEGNCAKLDKLISVDGKKIIFTPEITKEVKFAELPESFDVIIYDDVAKKDITSVPVKVIQPVYKFAVENELENVSLTTGALTQNSKSVKFTLKADYDGDGKYESVSKVGVDNDIKFSVDTGALIGKTESGKDYITFTPYYDTNKDKDTNISDLLGTHKLVAKAKGEGISKKSKEVEISVGNSAYQIIIDNQITDSFNLDTIKTNEGKIVFSIQADYNDDGSFGAVESWDLSVYDKLVIDSGELPGKFENEYDAGGNIIGKSFTPQYDENNNNGVVFTAVAGRVHTITAKIEQFNVSNSTTVEVIAPVYEVAVKKDGIKLVDVDIINNKEGVEFIISRNGRPLTKQELEKFEGYNVKLGDDCSWLKLETAIMEASDGSGYISCIPAYDGWTFISPKLWNWLSLFNIGKGGNEVILSINSDQAIAKISIGTSVLAWTIFVIAVLVLIVLIYLLICFFTRIRFIRGAFYKATFKALPNNPSRYVINKVTVIRSNKGCFKRYFIPGIFKTFGTYKKTVTSKNFTYKFSAKKSKLYFFKFTSLPYLIPDKKKVYSKGLISSQILAQVINEDRDLILSNNKFNGKAFQDKTIKMEKGRVLIDSEEKTMVFFVSDKNKRLLKKTYSKKKASRKKAAKKIKGTAVKNKKAVTKRNSKVIKIRNK